jgi:prepilin-type N-terminal cleavage/methylation domain-containing protein
MPKSSTANSDGFSIIEVMVASAILLVGFIGVMQALTIGTESLDMGRKQQIANQLIAAEIEKLRGGAWSTIASLPDSATITIGSAGAISGDVTAFGLSNRTASTADDNTALSSLANGFTCSFTRERLRPSSATATTVTFVKVIYTVRWSSPTGRAHRHTAEAYLAKNGLHLSYQQS